MSLEQQAMVLEQIAGRMTDAQVLELGHLRNVIGLVAFAVEARRVLQEIDYADELLRPEQDSKSDMLALVRDRRQWTEQPDMAAQVLCDVSDRLGALLEQGGAA